MGFLAGKKLLINFWATWCVPCVKEMPSLDRLQAMFPQDKFLVLPLSIDGPTKPKVAPFYKDQKLANLGLYFDKGRKTMQGLDVTLLPTSILVDAQGRELGRIEGDADHPGTGVGAVGWCRKTRIEFALLVGIVVDVVHRYSTQKIRKQGWRCKRRQKCV